MMFSRVWMLAFFAAVSINAGANDGSYISGLSKGSLSEPVSLLLSIHHFNSAFHVDERVPHMDRLFIQAGMVHSKAKETYQSQTDEHKKTSAVRFNEKLYTQRDLNKRFIGVMQRLNQTLNRYPNIRLFLVLDIDETFVHKMFFRLAGLFRTEEIKELQQSKTSKCRDIAALLRCASRH